MKAIINLIRKDFILFFNDKVSVSLTFIVPAVLIYIFGSVFGGGGGSAQEIRLAFINDNDSPAAMKLEKSLDTSSTFQMIKAFKDEKGEVTKFDTTSVKEFVKKGSAPAALVIPKDAFTDTSTAFRLKLYYDPKNDIENQVIQGMLQQIIMQSMPDLFTTLMWRKSEKVLGADSGSNFNKEIAGVVSQYFDVDVSEVLNPTVNDTIESSDSSSANFFQDIIEIDKVQLVGQDIVNPNVTRNVGGWALMFLLFTLTAAAASLFDEQKSGVILRILSAPVLPDHILWSKYIYSILLGIIQLTVLFFMGMLFFDIDIFSNFFNLMLVIIAGATACTAFGMLIAAFCSTSAQANGWGTFLILTMSAVGGAWFPTFLMPPFIQAVSKGTIVYWSVDGFLQVLWRDASFTDIIPNLLFLFGMAAVVNTISILRFRKKTF